MAWSMFAQLSLAHQLHPYLGQSDLATVIRLNYIYTELLQSSLFRLSLKSVWKLHVMQNTVDRLLVRASDDVCVILILQ